MRLVIILTVLFCTGAAIGQISTDEAMKRLQEKQASRQADRETLVMIKKGELADLRAQIATLAAQVETLESQIRTLKTKGTEPQDIKQPDADSGEDIPSEAFLQTHHAQAVAKAMQAEREYGPYSARAILDVAEAQERVMRAGAGTKATEAAQRRADQAKKLYGENSPEAKAARQDVERRKAILAEEKEKLKTQQWELGG